MRSRPNSWLSTLTQLGFTRKKNKARRLGKHRSLRVESLEDRRLLAITVDSALDDNGSGITLREAIGMVTPTNNVIDFDPSLNGDTIKLSNLGELVVDATMTIDASMLDDGITIVAYDPDNQEPGDTNYSDEKDGDGERVFKMSDPLTAGANIDITLKNLALTGGDVGQPLFDGDSTNDQQAKGGAIWSEENLTLIGVTITGNSAIVNEIIANHGGAAYEASGGGVYSEQGELVISQDSLIANNNAEIQISAVDDANVNGATFRARAEGGGIYSMSSSLSVTDSRISQNSAIANTPGYSVRPDALPFLFLTMEVSSQGGGIFFDGGSLTNTSSPPLKIIDSVAQGNQAVSVVKGIRINNAGAGLRVNSEGGGIYATNTFSTSSIGVELKNTTIARNSTLLDGSINNVRESIQLNSSGGGIHIDTSDLLSIANSSIANNEVDSKVIDSIIFPSLPSYHTVVGGGVSVRDSATTPLSVFESTISANKIVADISSTDFPDLFHVSGAGINIDSNSNGEIEVSQVTISGNSAEAIAESNLFSSAQRLYGGGIGNSGLLNPTTNLFGDVGTVAIRHSTITGNTLIDNADAEIAIKNTSDPLDFSQTLFTGTFDYTGGGGLGIIGDIVGSTTYSKATIDHSIIAGNSRRSPFSSGPAIDMIEGKDVYADDIEVLLLGAFQPTFLDSPLPIPDEPEIEIDHSLIGVLHEQVAQTDYPTNTGDAKLYAGLEIISAIDGTVNGIGNIDIPRPFGTRIDPDLGPLANNGGPTLTHSPNCGSPAVEAGDPSALAGIGTVPNFDQRGLGRVFDLPGLSGGPIDIGSVEIGLFDVPVLAADFDLDMDVDGADFSVWQQNNGLTAGATKSQGDANGDGMVNQVDLMIWSQQYGLNSPHNADFNNDTFIDEADLLIWQESYGVNAGGDADNDGDTDGMDFLIWQAQFAQVINCHQWVHSIGAFSELAPGEILVSTLRDENDGNYSLGDLSLREALAIADSTTGPDTIKFASNLHGTIELTQGELDIDTDVDIVGPGSDRLTIDAQSNSRGFNISDGVSTNLLDVSISGLTITDGYIAGSGAGIENDENLELTDVVLTDNVATNLGGAINHDFGKLSLIDSTLHSNEANHGGGVYGFFKTIDSLEIDGSTFSENEATSLGGGLFFKNVDAGGVDSSAKIINSTFSGNTAGSHSGGLRIRGSSQASTDVTIVNSTITGNEAPTAGGVFAYPTATVTMHNSILAGNSVTGSSTWTTDASGNIGGTTSSPSLNNLIGVGNTGLGVSNGVNQNLVGTYSTPQAAGLEVLADNGGPTQTHALLSTSDAIDAGDLNTAIFALNGQDFVDQRGYNRIFDDSTQTGSVDIGAYERGLIVTTAADENDVTFDFDDLSLREALASLSNYQANGIPESNVIEFDDAVVTVGSIQLYDKLDITEDVNLLGPGADQFEIDATGHDSVFDIDAGVVAAISGLQITDSRLSGIKSAGDLTLDGVEVLSNAGRGIESSGQSVLNVLNSTITGSGNVGLYLDDTTTNLVNTTVSGNNVTGILLLHGVATITNSTVTANTGGGAAGGILAAGTADVTLHNSIVAGNTSSVGMGTVDLFGTAGAFNSNSSNNLIGDAGNSGLSDGVTAAELGLTSLDYHNGGPTRTHALLNGSVAIDAADDSLLLALGYLEDQRGSNRYDDGDADGFARADIGAFELAADEFFGTI